MDRRWLGIAGDWCANSRTRELAARLTAGGVPHHRDHRIASMPIYAVPANSAGADDAGAELTSDSAVTKSPSRKYALPAASRKTR